MHNARQFIMRNLLYILFAVLTFAACTNDHDGVLDSSYETQLLDIVTYTGLGSDNHATFRLEGRDDEPGVDLFTNIGAPQKVAKYERVLMSYDINHQSADGTYWNVYTHNITRINYDSIRVNNNPISTYSRRPIKLISAWRSGEYINLHGQVEYTGKRRFLYMMVDRDTRGNELVEAYLVHDLLGTPSDSIFYWRDFYLSVNVGVLKSPRDPCKTLRLHINDASNPKVTYRDFQLK